MFIKIQTLIAMPGLRQKKKERTEKQILKASKQIFNSEGYNRATIAQIAEKAEIGVGTFYNYFTSKAEVFLICFGGDPDRLAAKTRELVENPEMDLTATLMKLIDIYLESYFKIEKSLWKEIIGAFATNVDENMEAMADFVKVDLQLVYQTEKLITHFKQRKILSEKVDENAAAQTIYGIFALQVLLFIYTGQFSYEEMKKNIAVQVELYFSSKLKH